MFNFFKKKQQQQEEESSSLASVNFSVDENNTVNVYVEWSEDCDHKILAELLFSINNGLYAKHIVNVLLSELKSDSEDQEFLSYTILEWKKHNDLKKYDNNIPIVKPSEFSLNVKRQ